MLRFAIMILKKKDIFSLSLLSFATTTINTKEMTIGLFKIPSIPLRQLELLREKLKNVEYPNELEKNSTVGWKYGAPRWAVEPLVQSWLHDYDWEKARIRMNYWNHYHAMIHGLHVHFIHEPSDELDAIPLLLMNGWPSNFYEFYKVIEPLRDGDNGNQV